MGNLPADGSNMFAKIIPPGPIEVEDVHPFVRRADLTEQIEQIITDDICLIDACGQICVDGDSIKRIARKIAALHQEQDDA